MHLHYGDVYFPYTEYCFNARGIYDIDDSICNYETTDNTSSCVSATLQCENMMCSAVISGSPRHCPFNTFIAANTTISQPIQCCYCASNTFLSSWWDCEIVTTRPPSISLSLSSTVGEYSNSICTHIHVTVTTY